jgi:hypothetical protein
MTHDQARPPLLPLSAPEPVADCPTCAALERVREEATSEGDGTLISAAGTAMRNHHTKEHGEMRPTVDVCPFYEKCVGVWHLAVGSKWVTDQDGKPLHWLSLSEAEAEATRLQGWEQSRGDA